MKLVTYNNERKQEYSWHILPILCTCKLPLVQQCSQT